MIRAISKFPQGLLFPGILLLPAAAAADPILVVSGALVADQTSVRLELAGERGLTLTGGGPIGGGLFVPHLNCRGFPDVCLPGERLSLLATWSGSDFPGTATVEGTSFPTGMIGPGQGEALVEFSGSVIAPLHVGMNLASASAPFIFRGLLSTPNDPRSTTYSLLGRGTATLNFSWPPTNAGGWVFESARYEFEPVPEPATLLLLGSGLAGLGFRRMRRREN